MGSAYDELEELEEKPEAEQWLDAAEEARRLERSFQVTALAWAGIAAVLTVVGFVSIPFGIVCGVAGLVGGLVIARIWGKRHGFALEQAAGAEQHR